MWFTKVGDDFKPGALESTMHWQVIWPRAIALAWQDPDFKAALLSDARVAIKAKFQYDLSPELDLTIVEAPYGSAGYAPGAVTDPWAGLPRLKLEIVLPPAPAAEAQAVAITVYQDTGRTYPFTCC